MEQDAAPDDSTPDETAPDGSEVRWLVRGDRGSMARFTLPVGAVSRAVAHRSVEELWFFVSGRGQMCVGDEVRTVEPGDSLRIPAQTRFQFRCTGDEPLSAVGVTMPPWPGPEEADPAPAYWPTRPVDPGAPDGS